MTKQKLSFWKEKSGPIFKPEHRDAWIRLWFTDQRYKYKHILKSIESLAYTILDCQIHFIISYFIGFFTFDTSFKIIVSKNSYIVMGKTFLPLICTINKNRAWFTFRISTQGPLAFASISPLGFIDIGTDKLMWAILGHSLWSLGTWTVKKKHIF